MGFNFSVNFIALIKVCFYGWENISDVKFFKSNIRSINNKTCNLCK